MAKKTNKGRSNPVSPPPEMREMPSRLRRARKARGLTQDQLAALAGASQGAISDAETDPLTEGATLAKIARMCSAMNVSLDFVVMGVGEIPRLRQDHSQAQLPQTEPRILDETQIPPMYPEAPEPPPQQLPETARNTQR